MIQETKLPKISITLLTASTTVDSIWFLRNLLRREFLPFRISYFSTHNYFGDKERYYQNWEQIALQFIPEFSL